MNSLGSCNRLSLNKETKQHVFDTYVSSVLDYGSEVFGEVGGGGGGGGGVRFFLLMMLKRFIWISVKTNEYLTNHDKCRSPIRTRNASLVHC